MPFRPRLLTRSGAVFAIALSAVVGGGCTCKQNVNEIKPSLSVSPVSLDFGPVKTGTQAVLKLKFDSRTNTAATISDISVEAGSAPGGPEAFTLGTKPTQVDALSSTEMLVTFSPTVLEAYEATIVVTSNDADHPTVRVPVLGVGAKPIIEVTPDCAASRMCVGTVVVSPPSIDFGAEPFQRLLPVDATKLPSVNIVNSGPVALKVTNVTFAGADAAAFVFAGNATFPVGGIELEPSAGRNLAIQFKPTSDTQQTYTASLMVISDDSATPTVTVELRGTLRANLPPVVCANLTLVTPPIAGEPPRDYRSAAQWAPLLVAPATGYDFVLTRDVRPDDLAAFSALSNASDATACTSDPEDGRAQLTFEWRLVSAPAGYPVPATPLGTTETLSFRSRITGEYVLSLTARDAQLHATTVNLKFAVAIKQDLVAQLQWPGFANVDLDVHLVRPSAITNAADPFSGAFDPFDSTTKTSGDINGYARTVKAANTTAGFNFDWGGAGAQDDPTLNVDDEGFGALVENVSLNYPENDPRCATTSCTYRVLVHYFKDTRAHPSPPGCAVDGGAGCHDGEACSCAAGDRCVADGVPVGDAGVGSGKCYAAPKPVVRLFFRGSPTAANVIPLDTLVPADELAIGSPCSVLAVADIEWPAKTAIGSLPDGGSPPPVVTVRGADGTGRIASPQLGRFGYRQAGGSLQCTPDQSLGSIQWYSRQPW